MARRTVKLGDWTITLAPDVGGRVARLSCRGLDILVPLPEAAFAPEHWPKAGAFPLVPFHNRVPGARFSWREREARLPVHPDTVPHALHGHGARMAWQIPERMSDDTVEMRIDSIPIEAWPWAFTARQHFQVDGNRLTVTLEIENRDSVAMPAGLGWHPYFPAGTVIEDNAACGWPVGADYLPSSAQRPRHELIGTTAYLTDWTKADIKLKSGLTLRMIREDGLAHLVRFAPEGAPFACLEPVSHAVAAMQDGPCGSMDEIAVGSRLTGRVTLQAQSG